MTTLIPNFAPQWTNRDPADFGMTLVELFSYMGDILNYYIDRAANESFITTATQRSSVLQLANLLGYTPTTSTASTVNLTFQNSSATPISLPALTQAATSLVANATTAQVVFETNSAIIVPPTGAALTAASASSTTVATYTYSLTTQGVQVGSSVTVSGVTPSYFNGTFSVTAIGGSSGAYTFTVANPSASFTPSGTGSSFGTFSGTMAVLATQGETISNEPVGTSNGSANQTFALLNQSVISNSVQVTINGTAYTQVDYLVDYGSYDPVFSAFTNANNITYLTFGDGISGIIPPNGATIYVNYRIGGGVVGNVASNTIKYVIKVPSLSAIPSGLSVSNQDIVTQGDGAASGGADPESTDSIRINAPLSIRAINRAVSLSDYAALAVQVTGVSKAIATANTYSAVTLYIAPAGDPGVAADNSTATTVFNTTATNVLNYLTNKAPANTTLTFQPPKYVGVYIVVNITVAPQYRQSSVIANVTSAINNVFYIDNVFFGQTISISDLHYAIGNVNGVAYQQVLKMVRADQDQTYTITNKALTSNVATLTTSVTHTLTVGETMSVTGVDTTFNGTYVVTAVTSNTFSYALVATNVSSVSSGGSVTALTVKDIVCASNEIPTLYELGTVASPSATGIGSVTLNATGGILS
jgi:hypothetical protein